jgi:hypothetical protein
MKSSYDDQVDDSTWERYAQQRSEGIFLVIHIVVRKRVSEQSVGYNNDVVKNMQRDCVEHVVDPQRI